MVEQSGNQHTYLYKVVFLALVILAASETILVLAICTHNEWHRNLLRFLSRVWERFVSYNVGSTAPGFVSSILLTVLGVVIVVAFIAFAKGKQAMKEHFVESAALALIGITTVILLVYGAQFAWDMARIGYEDHYALVNKIGSLETMNSGMVNPVSRDAAISTLRRNLADVQFQLAARKNMASVGDPFFYNMQQVLGAFQGYRMSTNGRRCVIWITAPHDSIAMGSVVGQLANAVTGCSTFGPQEGIRNSDLSVEAEDGIIPGVLLIHAPREDSGVNQLTRMLDDTVPTQRSYKLLSTEFAHYQDQGKMNEVVMWLQFGHKMHWKSENYSEGKPSKD